MVSESDNTATDALIAILGRDAVEAEMAKVGCVRCNTPLLTTREFFNLKDETHDELARQYVACDLEGRRALLLAKAETFASTNLRTSPTPRLVEEIEWYASAEEVVSGLELLKKAGASGGAEALSILAVNPGTGVAERYEYVGFKGGSEPGVLSLAYLLRRKSGAWIGVAAIWNSVGANLDAEKFGGLMERLLALLSAEAS
jgi:hypothetical protein